MSREIVMIPTTARNECRQLEDVGDFGQKSDDVAHKKPCTRLEGRVEPHENSVLMRNSDLESADTMYQCGTLTFRKPASSRFPQSIPQCRLHLQESHSSATPIFAGCPEWAKLLLYSQHQAGHSEKWLCSIFLNLTDDLENSLHSAFFAVMVLHKSYKVKAQQHMCNIMIGNAGNSAASDEPWFHDLTIDNEELKVFDRSRLCLLRATHDPSTRRRTEVYVNAALCRQTNMYTSEFLDAIANAALPEHVSHLEFVCGLAEGLLHFLDSVVVDVVRWAWPGRPAALMERRREQFFDSSGRNWRQVTSLREITSAEYDARSSSADGAAGAASLSGGVGGSGSSGLMSLRRAAGDLRDGAALLAAAASDRDSDETMATLASSPAGREQLARLAGEITRRFEANSRAARRTLSECPDIEAWARVRFPGMFPCSSDSCAARESALAVGVGGGGERGGGGAAGA